MRSLALVALLVSASSFASEYVSKKVSYTVFGRSGWSTTYYSCYSAQDLVEGHIETLGGINARVRCSGGIENWGATPIRISATFDAPLPNGGAVEEKTLKARSFDENCELHTTTLKNLLPAFPGVKVVSKRDSCMDNRTRWYYNIEVTH